MRRQIILEIIYGLLILLFVYTAISKLIDLNNFKNTLTDIPMLETLSGLLKWLIPGTELLIAAALYTSRYRKAGLYVALILMSVFTFYIGFLLLFRSQDLPCSCGGVLKQMTWKQHLLFNIFFIILPATGLYLEYSKPKKRELL